MSKLRGLFPVVLAGGFGVLNGYIVYAPAFQEMEDKKILLKQQQADIAMGPNMIEIPVSNDDRAVGIRAKTNNNEGLISGNTPPLISKKNT